MVPNVPVVTTYVYVSRAIQMGFASLQPVERLEPLERLEQISDMLRHHHVDA